MPRSGFTMDGLIRGYDDWKTTNPADFELSPPPDGSDDDEKEQWWAYLEGEMRDFAKKYGVASLMRVVSDACK